MWKAIRNYEGYYEVSSEGAVRSLDRLVIDSTGRHAGVERHLKGRPMKLTEAKPTHNGSSSGYLVVNLRKDGKSSVVPVHALVADTFIPNPKNLPTVNHIDGNKHNNCIDNLEWASYSENNTHAVNTGLRNPRGIAIGQYAKDGALIATYKSTCEAARQTGLSRGGIAHCVNGRSRESSGFIWRKLSGSATTIPQGSTQEDELPAEAQRLPT